ncbi:MAG: prepilin peptidase [Ruminiclostridium sp.]|nr:prepilin peptidase [Ruminiclostridium sp.]
MELFIILFLFATGLVMGSFYNVVIFRVPEEKSIVKPRSACGSCGTVLKTADLIPVFSYIFLKGKCRYCKEKISAQYPLVELLSGLIFVVLYLKFGLAIELFFSIYIMSVLLIVFFIDLKHQIIPNGLVLAGLIGSAAFFVLRFWYQDAILDGDPWYSPLLGMVATSGFLFLVAMLGLLIYKGEAMGMGDVKIFLPIGLFLGLKLGIMALVFSVVIGGLSGLFLIITKLKDRKSQIPFGPYIVAGTFLSLMFGQQVLMWYLGTFR